MSVISCLSALHLRRVWQRREEIIRNLLIIFSYVIDLQLCEDFEARNSSFSATDIEGALLQQQPSLTVLTSRSGEKASTSTLTLELPAFGCWGASVVYASPARPRPSGTQIGGRVSSALRWGNKIQTAFVKSDKWLLACTLHLSKKLIKHRVFWLMSKVD